MARGGAVTCAASGSRSALGPFSTLDPTHRADPCACGGPGPDTMPTLRMPTVVPPRPAITVRALTSFN